MQLTHSMKKWEWAMAENKMHELSHGVNCTYCCGIPITDSGAGAGRDPGTPEQQVQRAISFAARGSRRQTAPNSAGAGITAQAERTHPQRRQSRNAATDSRHHPPVSTPTKEIAKMAIKLNPIVATTPTMEQMMPSSAPAAFDIELRRVAELNDLTSDEALENPEIRKHMRDFMEMTVQGVDAPVIDQKTGKRQNVSIGAPGFETWNHFASIRRFEGQAAYEKAVRKIWKENPKQAEKIGLERPERAA
jgi:hypothetical protein